MISQSFIRILFAIIMDCSPSMSWPFDPQRLALYESGAQPASPFESRRGAALEGAWKAVSILKGAPSQDKIVIAQVLFEHRAKTYLQPTPVSAVGKAHLGNESFTHRGGTNFLGALVESERLIWHAQTPMAATSSSIFGPLVAFLESLAPKQPSGKLPPPPYEPHLFFVTDGEHNTGGSAADCICQADRLKAAGVRIYGQGIGDPANFGLLKQLVSDPDEDFGVHDTPESLRRAFARVAQRLVSHR
jgi:hypothetical protein